MFDLRKITIFLGLLLAVAATSPAQTKGNGLVIGQGAHWEATISTSEGSVTIELFNDTPIHRDNFVKLASEGFYDYQLFHRAIRDYVIQAGDPDSRGASVVRKYGDRDAGYTMTHEIQPHYFHRRGMVAAAREGDDVNPERESSGSHFYIVVGAVQTDSTLTAAAEKIAAAGGHPLTPDRIEVYKNEGGLPHLDGSYTIFGRVTSGMGIVEKIAKKKTDSHDRPEQDVYIKKITLKKVKD